MVFFGGLKIVVNCFLCSEEFCPPCVVRELCGTAKSTVALADVNPIKPDGNHVVIAVGDPENSGRAYDVVSTWLGGPGGNTVPFVERLTDGGMSGDMIDEFAEVMWHGAERLRQKLLKAGWKEEEIGVNFAMKEGPMAGDPGYMATSMDGSKQFPSLTNRGYPMHMHLLARWSGDYERNDLVYTMIDDWDPTPGLRNMVPEMQLPSDEERKNRTPQMMQKEAETYKAQRYIVTLAEDFVPPFAEEVKSNGVVRMHQGEDSGFVFKFSTFDVPAANVFYESEHSFAFVNLRPLMAGHVLVSPKEVIDLVHKLTMEQWKDLWHSVTAVQRMLGEVYDTRDFNIGIQNGKEAGRSVPHVHVHVIPRCDPRCIFPTDE